jgi:hypothetical protein
MKRQLQNGNDFLEIKDTSFKRAYIYVNKVNLPDELGSFTDIDLRQMTITIEATKEGVVKSTSFNAVGPCYKYAYTNGAPFSADLIQFGNNEPTTSGYLINYDDDTQAGGFLVLPLLENFILKGADKVKISVQWQREKFFAGAGVDSSASQVYIVLEQGNDLVQLDLNLPEYIPITNNIQNPSWSFGSLSRLYLLGMSRNSPINSTVFQSDQIKLELDRQDLNVLAYENLTNVGGTFPVPQSQPYLSNIRIFDVEPSAVTKCVINLNINTEEVVTSMNYIYIEHVVTSRAIAVAGLAQSDKIRRRKLNFRGL